MERLSFVHLSGARQGEVDLLDTVPALLGSDPQAEVVVPQAAARHAYILSRGGQIVLQDGGSEPGTLLAGHHVHEAVLRDGDVIELGAGGPTLRFHHQRERRVRARSGLRAVLRSAWREVSGTSREFKLVVLMILVMAVAMVVRSHRESARLERQMSALGEVFKGAEVERQTFETRVEAERQRSQGERDLLVRRIDEYKRREEELRGRLTDAANGEVKGLKQELSVTRERLHTLESERAAGESIIRDYGAGVCLIQGSYAYYDREGRPARSQVDDKGRSKRDEDGNLVLTADGNGAIHTIDYFGTGFLVDRRGHILSNRHVAEPWTNEEITERLTKSGYKARFVLFRAFFPKEREALELETERYLEVVDLALLKADVRGRRIPTLPLDDTGQGAVAGQPVVVVGYPTGLEAILAKADSGVVKEILDNQGSGSEVVTEALSQRGLIRPSTTQGHIGDVTRTDIVFDAPTTQGGSGGPVFNKSGRVIAVEYAVLQKFGGNSFGVPIRYALELLKAPPRKKGNAG